MTVMTLYLKKQKQFKKQFIFHQLKKQSICTLYCSFFYIHNVIRSEPTTFGSVSNFKLQVLIPLVNSLTECVWFWPLLKWALFFEAAGAVAKIGSSQTTITNFSLSKSVKHSVEYWHAKFNRYRLSNPNQTPEIGIVSISIHTNFAKSN